MNVFIFLLAAALVCPLLSSAQAPKVNHTAKQAYHPDLTPNDAATHAWHWFDNYTQGAPDTRQIKLRNEKGFFTGIGSFAYVSRVASGADFSRGTVFYTVRLRIHDSEGAYSYEITDFSHQARVSLNAITTDEKYPYAVKGDKMWHNMVWKDIKQQVDAHARQLAETLNATMQAPSIVVKRPNAPKIIVVRN